MPRPCPAQRNESGTLEGWPPFLPFPPCPPCPLSLTLALQHLQVASRERHLEAATCPPAPSPCPWPSNTCRLRP
eukprot:364672-Chlamydomonas_euryale.AAC.1